MKDIKNIIEDEACKKYSETEDTKHLILECGHYAEKIWSCLQQLLNKAQRRLCIHQRTYSHIHMDECKTICNTYHTLKLCQCSLAIRFLQSLCMFTQFTII